MVYGFILEVTDDNWSKWSNFEDNCIHFVIGYYSNNHKTTF